MKKIIYAILIATMAAISLAACGQPDPASPPVSTGSPIGNPSPADSPTPPEAASTPAPAKTPPPLIAPWLDEERVQTYNLVTDNEILLFGKAEAISMDSRNVSWGYVDDDGVPVYSSHRHKVIDDNTVMVMKNFYSPALDVEEYVFTMKYLTEPDIRIVITDENGVTNEYVKYERER